MEPDRLLAIDMRHLVALQAVAREGAFGRAALQLGYTQSAVSQQIATLERIVGERLVERPGGPRPISLTEAGKLLLGHADGIIARLQAAQADLAALADGTAGTLRVGTYQSVGARILPALLRRFRSEWPHVDVQLREYASDEELLELIERGELDLTFVMLPLAEGPFEAIQLLRDPYVLLVAAGAALAQRRVPPTLREIGELPLIGYRQCRSAVDGHFRSRGVEANVVFRSDDNGTVQGLVAAGIGAALVPRLTVDEADEQVAVLDLGSRIPPRLIGLAWHRDRYRLPASIAFADAAGELCAAVERSFQPLQAA